jgi:hypothetical protein
MATEPQLQPSFSPRRKWSIGLDVLARTLVVLAVVLMINYLSAQYFKRLFVSSQTQIALSSQTIGVLKSLTNQIKVTLYYDKEDLLYSTLLALLKEYRDVNRRIQVVTVDYLWDAAMAQKIKSKYNLGDSTGENEKNLVIFECEGQPPKIKIVPGKMLADFTLEQVPNEKQPEYRYKFTAFNGEKIFTACVLAVSSLKPFRAYYLQGHREHPVSGDEVSGYVKFAAILQQNYVQVEPLALLGTNAVPMDCNLLIIAGPIDEIDSTELEKISQYLDQGGRLLALFNSAAKDRQSGLARILARSGVIVGDSEIVDVANSLKGNDIAVGFSQQHPAVRSLAGSRLYLIAPRTVTSVAAKNAAADAPKVSILAASMETAVLRSDPKLQPRQYPVAVAVEKGAPPGVVTERGSTRIIVVGDSFFLANGPIDKYANSDFARLAINWLLDRPHLLEGIGSQPVREYHITMTQAQLQTVRWVLLAIMPGAILLLGGLVWVRRRK